MPQPSDDPLARQVEVAWDYRNWALLQQQVPLDDFAGVVTNPARIDEVDFVEVRAFVYGVNRAALGLDDEVDGCSATDPLSKTGTLCPSVVVPGHVLNAEQRVTLLDALADRYATPRVPLCSGNPFHAFVFYRSGRPRNVPVASVAFERIASMNALFALAALTEPRLCDILV